MVVCVRVWVLRRWQRYVRGNDLVSGIVSDPKVDIKYTNGYTIAWTRQSLNSLERVDHVSIVFVCVRLWSMICKLLLQNMVGLTFLRLDFNAVLFCMGNTTPAAFQLYKCATDGFQFSAVDNKQLLPNFLARENYWNLFETSNFDYLQNIRKPLISHHTIDQIQNSGSCEVWTHCSHSRHTCKLLKYAMVSYPDRWWMYVIYVICRWFKIYWPLHCFIWALFIYICVVCRAFYCLFII